MAKKKSNSKAPVVDPDLIVVLPGDNVTKHIRTSSASSDVNDATTTTTTTKKVVPKLGPGLRCDTVTDQVYATVAGRLVKRQRGSGNVYFVQQNVQRYRPVLQDRVIGIVEDRMGNDGAGGDVYRVNIGASHPAVLSSLAFEGATKRNKPSFSPGQLLYARMSDLPAGGLLDPVLSCILGPHDDGIPRKDFMTNEGCYGELKGGTVCRIPTGLARELLHPNNLVLAELAKGVAAFEIAVGVNGYLWIHSRLPEYTILIQNAIQNSEVMTENQVRAMVKSLVFTVEKQLQIDRDSGAD
jgi:exosome complex component RRP40